MIAEIGHNHQGSLEKAKELFRAARDAGVDAVKLQKRANRRLFTRALYDSPYENENSFGATYGEHREALELGRDAYLELRDYADELGLVFFATAFDEESADLLEELDLPAYKIASGDLRNTPLLRHVASFGKPMIVSTGGATIEDVDRAIETVLPLNAARLRPAVHGRVPGRGRGAESRRDRDAARALPGCRGRALRPSGRDRDGGRRVHARRSRDREALHAEPCRQGHRPRVLAHARGDAQARARPVARSRPRSATGSSARFRARRSRSRRWGRSSSRPARCPRVTCSPRATSWRSRPRTRALPPYLLDELLGRHARSARWPRRRRSSPADVARAPLGGRDPVTPPGGRDTPRDRARRLRLRRRLHGQPRLGERDGARSRSRAGAATGSACAASTRSACPT